MSKISLSLCRIWFCMLQQQYSEVQNLALHQHHIKGIFVRRTRLETASLQHNNVINFVWNLGFSTKILSFELSSQRAGALRNISEYIGRTRQELAKQRVAVFCCPVRLRETRWLCLQFPFHLWGHKVLSSRCSGVLQKRQNKLPAKFYKNS